MGNRTPFQENLVVNFVVYPSRTPDRAYDQACDQVYDKGSLRKCSVAVFSQFQLQIPIGIHNNRSCRSPLLVLPAFSVKINRRQTVGRAFALER